MTARKVNGIWTVKTATQEVFGLNLASCIELIKGRSQSVAGA